LELWWLSYGLIARGSDVVFLQEFWAKALPNNACVGQHRMHALSRRRFCSVEVLL